VESVTCKTIWYMGYGPYEVDFEVNCYDPKFVQGIEPVHTNCLYLDVSLPEEAMLNTSLIPQIDNAITISFTATYDTVGDYRGSITSVDDSEVQTDHEVRINIRKADPQFFVIHNEETLTDMDIINGSFTNVTPFEIQCCDDGESFKTETFTLRNIGYGTGRITEIYVEGARDVSVANITETEVLPGEDFSFDIKYVPTSDALGSASLIIKGDLSGDTPEFMGLDFGSFEMIKLDLDLNPGCQFAEAPVINFLEFRCNNNNFNWGPSYYISVDYEDEIGVIGATLLESSEEIEDHKREAGRLEGTLQLVTNPVYSGGTCGVGANNTELRTYNNGWSVRLINECGLTTDSSLFDLTYYTTPN